ncbi:MAG: response regulator [Clostridia bacterium]|nr:response regulator [Clostridia bacterium]
MTNRMNILCAVRDERTLRGLRSELDDGEHCTVNIVSTGTAAIESIHRQGADILVIDALLPEMDGLCVIDCLRAELGERMPCVIGGSMMTFSDEGFARRGVKTVLRVPWQLSELREAVFKQIAAREEQIDWKHARSDCELAQNILDRMGMKHTLKGFAYLSWSAALAYENETRMQAIGEKLYAPIARRFAATPQSIERLIRHAVERMMDDAQLGGLYRFFGNTIDPTRGKPTNAQVIAMLVQRMRVEKKE